MRLRIGSAFGIPIFLHWTFFLLPLWILWTNQGDGPFELPVIFTVVLLSFVCIVMHEFGHVLMARRFRIGTQDVTLYPIGGVARLKAMTEKPLEEFLIAVAGPVVNVVIATLLIVVLAPIAVIDLSLVRDTFVGQVSSLLIVTNVGLVLFNLVPAFPMDGGRVLRAMLSAFLGHAQGTRIAVYVGFAMAALMGIVGVYMQNLLPVIAILIFLAGQQELMVLRMRERQRQWEDEEPLEVLPVRPREPLLPLSPAPVLMFQPKISVYTWDNQTGTWNKEPSAPA